MLAAGDIEAGDSILMVDLGRAGAPHAPPASRSALGLTWCGMEWLSDVSLG